MVDTIIRLVAVVKYMKEAICCSISLADAATQACLWWVCCDSTAAYRNGRMSLSRCNAASYPTLSIGLCVDC